jgi:transketolase
MGSCIAELIVAEHPVPMKMLGIDDLFCDTGPYEELLAMYGLQGDKIAETVEKFLG